MSYVDYHKKLGCLPSALLLNQLVYWCGADEKSSRLRLKRLGELWLVKSRAELMAETALSEHQLKKGLTTLKSRGLIRAEVHLFRPKGADISTTHSYIQVCREALKKMMSTPPGEDPVTAPGRTPITAPGTVPVTAPYVSGITAVTTAVTTAGDGQAIGKNMQAKDILNRMGKTGEDKAAKPNSSLPTGIQGNTPLPPAKLPSGQPLHIRWKSHQAGATGGFVPDLKAKDKGQLAHITKAIGSEKAQQVVDYVWGYWLKFVEKTKSDKGLTVVPATPQIGFTLMHYDIALQLIAGKAPATGKGYAPTYLAAVPAAPQQLFTTKPTLSPSELAAGCPKPDNQSVQSIAQPDEGLTPEEIQADLEFFSNPANHKKGGMP